MTDVMADKNTLNGCGVIIIRPDVDTDITNISYIDATGTVNSGW